MADILRRVDRKDEARGFTLVELLVVIAIIGVLAGLLLPVIRSAKRESEKAVCKNNLRQIAIQSGTYASDYRGVYPWPRPVSGTQTDLSEDADARACIELLYRYGYIDEPKVFLCESAKTDEPAEALETEQERRTSFHLEENNCSYTWRKKLTTTNNDTRTPLSGDKRHGEDGLTNHVDGRHVAFLQGNVEFFNIEKLEQTSFSGTKRARTELIGFDRIGRGN
jgi:prepilin-type N-terminal cleavage/methylation domain-containing protein